jgi:hypothetical protein
MNTDDDDDPIWLFRGVPRESREVEDVGTDREKWANFDRESGASSWGFGWECCDLAWRIVSLNSARGGFRGVGLDFAREFMSDSCWRARECSVRPMIRENHRQYRSFGIARVATGCPLGFGQGSLANRRREGIRAWNLRELAAERTGRKKTPTGRAGVGLGGICIPRCSVSLADGHEKPVRAPGITSPAFGARHSLGGSVGLSFVR